ncbi:hypothetical protein OSB04_031098 [Centaurea solstitialis]|uniref:Uncharacterized protein n=1 Tax=Centaurea solstitialis TaxID=347529 RepID=A0AA38S8V7_9ASTR|nr:hypothetical protein OSB04_031098 [Centaurea solstitialis]
MASWRLIFIISLESFKDGSFEHQLKSTMTYLKLLWRPLTSIDGTAVGVGLIDSLDQIAKHVESWGVSPLEAIEKIPRPTAQFNLSSENRRKNSRKIVGNPSESSRTKDPIIDEKTPKNYLQLNLNVPNNVRRGVAAMPSLKPWKPRRGYGVFQGVNYGGKSLMSYDSEQTAITEFRLQITSMLFLSSAISSTSLMEEVFTSVDRISRLQNRLVSLLILILIYKVKLQHNLDANRNRSVAEGKSVIKYSSDIANDLFVIFEQAAELGVESNGVGHQRSNLSRVCSTSFTPERLTVIQVLPGLFFLPLDRRRWIPEMAAPCFRRCNRSLHQSSSAFTSPVCISAFLLKTFRTAFCARIGSALISAS